jgi:hypothetical protein
LDIALTLSRRVSNDPGFRQICTTIVYIIAQLISVFQMLGRSADLSKQRGVVCGTGSRGKCSGVFTFERNLRGYRLYFIIEDDAVAGDPTRRSTRR